MENPLASVVISDTVQDKLILRLIDCYHKIECNVSECKGLDCIKDLVESLNLSERLANDSDSG